MLTIRSDSLHPRPLQSLPAQVLAGEHLRPLDRAESGRSACQSLTKILAKTPPAMSIHPTGNPPPQARLQYNSRPIKRPSPTGTATDYLICRVNSLNRPPIVSESSSSLTVWADKLDRSANLFDFTSHLAYTNHPRLFCYSQSFIMIPQPNRDQALLRSFLSNLAKSCYWSSLIRPLVFLILACQLKHSQLLDRSSAKLLDQLDFFFHKLFKQICPSPLPPPTKSPKPFSAPPPPKRLRAARGFRCSALVDSSDSSILHEHQPSPLHLNRSSACRTVPRTAIFIRSSSTPPTPLEVHRLAARAQSQMERSPYYAAEDCLDGDQRQQRYYLVNAYRAKLASDCSAVLTEYSSPTWQPCEMGIDADEDELEPLEDLLEWDSSTRLN